MIHVGKIDHVVNIIGKIDLLHGEIGICMPFYTMDKNKLHTN